MTSTPGFPPEVEKTVERVRELSDRVIEQGKKNGLAWLEASEKVLESVLRLEQQVANESQLELSNTFASTHADFVREVSKVYLDAVRKQLK